MSGSRIDRYLPQFDVHEVHRRRFDVAPAEVWKALLEADLGGSWLIRGLMGLRLLPTLLLRRPIDARSRGPWRLRDLERAGFGRLDEEPGREIVLGVDGRFWRPTGNVAPFERSRFESPVAEGMARGVWNFAVEADGSGGTILSTETRVRCGDAASRRKFRLYWLFVRPGSGLIRHVMLSAVGRTLRHAAR